MPRDDDIDRLESDWLGGDDAERGVESSTMVLGAMAEGRIDPVQNLELLEAAIEPQFDGPGGKPVRVLEVMRGALPEFRRAEMAHDQQTPERLDLRCRPQVILTRAYHLMPGNERWALENGYALLMCLVGLAGGFSALADILRRPTPNPVAENAVGALGIFMAILRRDRLAPATRDGLVDRCRGLLQAYVVDTQENPVIYRRTLALAAQGFYLFKELGLLEDRPLVEALYRLDVAVRPDHARAQATVALRELEWARFQLDEAAARRHRAQVGLDLQRQRMPRHLRAVIARGYLAF
jgi:hypothetical protein